MTENEKRLREALVRLRNIVNTLQGLKVVSDAGSALDAILAEHRAEVEELTTLVAGKNARALEVYAAGEVDAKVSTARDAALEEAKQAVTTAFEADEDVAAQDVIDALKSQPARQYVDAEKVREVLRVVHGFDDNARVSEALSQVAGMLDLDLASRSTIPPEGKQ